MTLAFAFNRIKQVAWGAALIGVIPAHAARMGYDAEAACGSVYQTTSPLTKSVAGEPSDTKFAPAVDQCLATYALNYKDTPSFETYQEKKKNDILGGDNAATYEMVQRWNREQDQTEFRKVLEVIASLEKLMGPGSAGEGQSLDPAATDYTRCLRNYMVKSLNELPETTNYSLKRADLLRQIQ